jgi:hypothetical protein
MAAFSFSEFAPIAGVRAAGDQRWNDNNTDIFWITRIAPGGGPGSAPVVGIARTAWGTPGEIISPRMPPSRSAPARWKSPAHGAIRVIQKISV